MRFIKSLLIILIAISSIGCKKPTVEQILLTARWSVNEACSVEWLDEIQCNRFYTSLSVAESFTSKGNPDQTREALRQFFMTEITNLPANSRLIPYYQWVVDFLSVLQTTFVPSH